MAERSSDTGGKRVGGVESRLEAIATYGRSLPPSAQLPTAGYALRAANASPQKTGLRVRFGFPSRSALSTGGQVGPAPRAEGGLVAQALRARASDARAIGRESGRGPAAASRSLRKRLAASLPRDTDRRSEPSAAATSRSFSAALPRRPALGLLRRLTFRPDPLGKHVRTPVDLLEDPRDRDGPVADRPC
jgi:hypothetical protein